MSELTRKTCARRTSSLSQGNGALAPLGESRPRRRMKPRALQPPAWPLKIPCYRASDQAGTLSAAMKDPEFSGGSEAPALSWGKEMLRSWQPRGSTPSSCASAPSVSSSSRAGRRARRPRPGRAQRSAPPVGPAGRGPTQSRGHVGPPPACQTLRGGVDRNAVRRVRHTLDPVAQRNQRHLQVASRFRQRATATHFENSSSASAPGSD